MSNYEITLQCMVHPQGVNVSHIPSNEITIPTIDISASKSVGDLKEAIYAEKPKAFLDITADELIALNENPDAYTTIRFSKKRELIHVEELASIFPRNNLPKSEHVHVLVEQPIHLEGTHGCENFYYKLKEKHQITTNETIKSSTIDTSTTDTSAVIDPLLRQKIGHVVHRNVDNFFDSFFPMSHEHIDAFVKECTRNGKWDNEWVEWPKRGSKEIEIYQPFTVLANYIIWQFSNNSSITFIVHADHCPLQERDGAINCKPDIVLVDSQGIVRKDGKEIVHWRDIHVTGEINVHAGVIIWRPIWNWLVMSVRSLVTKLIGDLSSGLLCATR